MLGIASQTDDKLNLRLTASDFARKFPAFLSYLASKAPHSGTAIDADAVRRSRQLP
jgi:hypothetical protein